MKTYKKVKFRMNEKGVITFYLGVKNTKDYPNYGVADIDLSNIRARSKE